MSMGEFMGRHNLYGSATLRQSGNVFFALFGAVGLVGVLGASAMTIMKGPVRAMQNVTQKTVAENQMIAGGRLSLVGAGQQAQGGDCDGDGYIEPVPWVTNGTGTAPVGGGFIPATLGAARQDPWGNTYGYCIWDHGTKIDDATCGGASQLRLRGTSAGEDKVAIAIISSGANRTFETSCNDDPTYITRVANSDDVIMEYTYAESSSLSGGLWNIKTGAPQVAEIAKNLEVKNAGGDVVFGVDSTTDTTKPSIKVDFVQKLTPAKKGVEFLSNIVQGATWLSGDGDNEGVFVASNGYVGINEGAPAHGLTIKGTGGANDDTVSYSYGNTSNASVIRGYKARGTEAARTTPLANDYFMTYGANGWDGSAWQTAGDIHTRAFTDWATEESSYMQFNTRVAGTTAERMRIHGNGNVGIGNNVPSQLLTVGYGLSGTGTDTDMIEVRSRGHSGISILGDYGNLSGETGGAFLRLSIDANTAVTSNWGGFLSAVQNAGEDGTGGTYTDTIGNSILLGTKGAMPLQLGTAGSVTMTVTTDNKVGLGTTVPSVPLHLNYNNDITAIGTGGSFMIGTVGGGNFIMDNNELQVRSGLTDPATMLLQNFGGNLTIGPTGSSRFYYMADTGNVSIGGLVPTQKLHVNGNAIVTGNVGMGGFLSESPTGAYGLTFFTGGAMAHDVSSATYDVWLQGSTTTNVSGTERNLAVLGRNSNDTLYLNYASEYGGGTIIGGPVTIQGDITATGSGLGDNLGNHIATKALAMGSFKITGLATPTAASDAATKAYVDSVSGLQTSDADLRYLRLTGGTLTGNLWFTSGATRYLGTTDAFSLVLRTNNVNALTINSAQNATFAGAVTVGGTLAVADNAITSSAGTIRDANGGWVRTYNDTGWYNGTHAGGWYMTDTSWVKSYNNKGVYTGGNMRADGQFQGDVGDAVTAPSFSFSSDPNTGMWHPGTDVAGITAGGQESIRFYPTYIHAMSNQIKNLAAPTSANDATTKAYVDSKVAGSTNYIVQGTCTAENDNNGCTVTVSCTSRDIAIASRSSWDLESSGGPTYAEAQALQWNQYQLSKTDSDTPSAGMTIGGLSFDPYASSGTKSVIGDYGSGKPFGGRSVTFRCYESDSNGGDCHIKAEVLCMAVNN